MRIGHKITEITGVPGSGKTYYIEKNHRDKMVLLGGMPLAYGPARRIMISILLSVYAIVSRSIGLGQIWWLLKESLTYDETLFSRINALRNSMTKFGCKYYNSMNSIIIDEGVSHIPFILGLNNEGIDAFVRIFHNHLKDRKIIYIQTPPAELLHKRLTCRGHKRIRTVEDVEEFIDINIRIAEHYKKTLSGSGLDVTFIQV